MTVTGLIRYRLENILIFSLLCSGAGLSETPNCAEVKALARVAQAKSPAALVSEKREIHDGYRARLVYAARSLELHPKNRDRALELLSLIPIGDRQQTEIMTLGDSLCSEESVPEMQVLGALRDRIPRDLATAVVIVPEKLSEYLSYALVSTQDPHNDYATQMERVCRKVPDQFRSAVHNLPPDKKERFVTHVFDPQACRAIALPEAQ